MAAQAEAAGEAAGEAEAGAEEGGVVGIAATPDGAPPQVVGVAVVALQRKSRCWNHPQKQP